MFPLDYYYQVMHLKLFPKGIVHAECVAGDIDEDGAPRPTGHLHRCTGTDVTKLSLANILEECVSFGESPQNAPRFPNIERRRSDWRPRGCSIRLPIFKRRR